MCAVGEAGWILSWEIFWQHLKNLRRGHVTGVLGVGIPPPIPASAFRSAGRGRERGRETPLVEGHHQEGKCFFGVQM